MDKQALIAMLRRKKVHVAIGGGALLASSFFAAIYNHCSEEGVLTETLTTLAVRQLECENVEAVKNDMLALSQKFDFCSKTAKDHEPTIVDLPAGVWSGVATACFAMLKDIENMMTEDGEPPEAWKCKGTELKREEMEKACQELGR